MRVCCCRGLSDDYVCGSSNDENVISIFINNTAAPFEMCLHFQCESSQPVHQLAVAITHTHTH